jgi:hypothetical protein
VKLIVLEQSNRLNFLLEVQNPALTLKLSLEGVVVDSLERLDLKAFHRIFHVPNASTNALHSLAFNVMTPQSH